MSILISFGGCVVAALFALAGYRLANEARYREMKNNITYHGRVQAFYDEVCRSSVKSVASLLKRAVVAQSVHCPSRL